MTEDGLKECDQSSIQRYQAHLVERKWEENLRHNMSVGADLVKCNWYQNNPKEENNRS